MTELAKRYLAKGAPLEIAHKETIMESPMYIINQNNEYLQGITQNVMYAKSTAPTMGNAHCYSEYSTVWGNAPCKIERMTAAGYIKILQEEQRWEGIRLDPVTIFTTYENCNTPCDTICDPQKDPACTQECLDACNVVSAIFKSKGGSIE